MTGSERDRIVVLRLGSAKRRHHRRVQTGEYLLVEEIKVCCCGVTELSPLRLASGVVARPTSLEGVRGWP
ncbi:hypothetical protein GBA65_21055 (plasmid) [Rubrobacter marinus]|uniref:Uncharacterized protein n=1 Tax=Rubrobacter marinus TaxID=2653852 RepID=A0A6G8Q3A5_9ACTN|nr:hypothetical protein [Rubrobacter marinus]QIN80952.1 hypothetical protein GBA65_21055 [Rubrobacter marinus]